MKAKMSEYILIFSTISSKDEADKLAKTLVDQKLAACVNIIRGISSIYEWKDKICIDDEILLLIKSRKDLFDEIKSAIISLHPYELPEIISIPIIDGLDPYLKWIDENTKT